MFTKTFLTILLSFVGLTTALMSQSCEFPENPDYRYLDFVERSAVTTLPNLPNFQTQGLLELEYSWKVGRENSNYKDMIFNFDKIYAVGQHASGSLNEIIVSLMKKVLWYRYKMNGITTVKFELPACWYKETSTTGASIYSDSSRRALDERYPGKPMTAYSDCGGCCLYELDIQVIGDVMTIVDVRITQPEICPQGSPCLITCDSLELDSISFVEPPLLHIPICNGCEEQIAERKDVSLDVGSDSFYAEYYVAYCDSVPTIMLPEIGATNTDSPSSSLSTVFPKTIKAVLFKEAAQHDSLGGTFPITRGFIIQKCWSDFGIGKSIVSMNCNYTECCYATYTVEKVGTDSYEVSTVSVSSNPNVDCMNEWNCFDICAMMDFGDDVPLPKMSFNHNTSPDEFGNYYSKVIPNPADDNVTIEFQSPTKGGVKLEVYNSSGQLILELSSDVNSGLSNFNFDTKSFAVGAYTYGISLRGSQICNGNFIIHR